MKRLAPFFIVFMLVGCSQIAKYLPLPETPREALVVAEVSYNGVMRELIVLRETDRIGDAAWLEVKMAARDIQESLKLARIAVIRDAPAEQYIRAIQIGIRSLQLRIAEAGR